MKIPYVGNVPYGSKGIPCCAQKSVPDALPSFGSVLHRGNPAYTIGVQENSPERIHRSAAPLTDFQFESRKLK